MRAYKKKQKVWRQSRLRLLETLCTSDKGGYWAAVDKIIGISQRRDIPIPIERLTKHFQRAVFNMDAGDTIRAVELTEDEDTKAELVRTLGDTISDGRYFSKGHVMRALKRVGIDKAGGSDGIPSGVVARMRSSKAFLDTLYGLYVMFVHLGYWPPLWNEILIAAVPKPSKPPLLDESYRPIHLISVLAKVFASVVEGRLSEWVSRSEEQFGFEKGHGARDNVLVASAVFEKYAKVGVHCCFVDFKAAFDSVDRNKLLGKLRMAGVQERIVKTIARMYTNVAATVKGSDARFVENQGVKQGDPLGPRLFNIFIKDLPKALHTAEGTDPACLAERIVRCLFYADDLLLFATTVEGLQRQLDALACYCKEWGLVVNTKETEYMHVNSAIKKDRPDGPSVARVAPVTFAGSPIVWSSAFKYVGVWFGDDGSLEEFYKRMLERARGALFACDGRAVRLDRSCPVALRCMMARVYVYPLFLYCCEALPISDEYVRKVNKLLYEYAIRITGVYGKPDSSLLRADCGLPDVGHVLSRSRASYMMVVRSRKENHLTRLALLDVQGRRRGMMHRFWYNRALGTLRDAGVDVDSGLGGHRAGLREIKSKIDKLKDRRSLIGERMRANPTYNWVVEGLIESKGYDISAAGHGDAVRLCMREDGATDIRRLASGDSVCVKSWAAHYHAALPKAHLAALSSLRFGTSELARNRALDQPVCSRLCPYCACTGKAHVEDEMHLRLVFDCPAYEDLRFALLVDLQAARIPFRPQPKVSLAARALNAILNPSCFAAARAVARFAHKALTRRATGLKQTGVDTESACGLARAGLAEWLGMEIPPPVSMSLHKPSLLPATRPAVLRDVGGELGVSRFNPFRYDVKERSYGLRKQGPPPPPDGPLPTSYDSLASGESRAQGYRGGMGDPGSPQGGLLGTSVFDPWEYDLLDLLVS